MRVTYQSTMAERVRDHMRLLELTSSTPKYLRNRIILVVAAAAAALILLPSDAAQGAQFILLAGAFWIGCGFALRRGRRVAGCRSYLNRLYGSDAPVDAEVEMDENGVTINQGERRLDLEWTRITTIADRPDGIELTTGSSAIARIPNRAFPSSAAREEWLSFMKTHHSQ